MHYSTCDTMRSVKEGRNALERKGHTGKDVRIAVKSIGAANVTVALRNGLEKGN